MSDPIHNNADAADYALGKAMKLADEGKSHEAAAVAHGAAAIVYELRALRHQLAASKASQ